METIVGILVALSSTLLGGFFGAWFQYWFQNRKTNKVRLIAIKALDVLARYAKPSKTYADAAAEFNNALNIVEKRAVLVALCKLGIPVEKSLDTPFDIARVRFESKPIDKGTLSLMKGQVNKGVCDDMFFSDVDSYFSSNLRLLALRAVAKKYVDIDLSLCICDKKSRVVNHPMEMSRQFTPGEMCALYVFRAKSCMLDYFDENGRAIPDKMERLKEEIDLGLWDNCFYWDYEAYQNIRNQNQMAMVFSKYMKTSENGQNTFLTNRGS